jgi:DNA-binding Xre family transcriptional regulator
MELIDKISKNIEKRREGISVDKLSKLADVPISTLNKIRGKEVKDVRVSTLIAIASALNCSINDLIQ